MTTDRSRLIGILLVHITEAKAALKYGNIDDAATSLEKASTQIEDYLRPGPFTSNGPLRYSCSRCKGLCDNLKGHYVINGRDVCHNCKRPEEGYKLQAREVRS